MIHRPVYRAGAVRRMSSMAVLVLPILAVLAWGFVSIAHLRSGGVRIDDHHEPIKQVLEASRGRKMRIANEPLLPIVFVRPTALPSVPTKSPTPPPVAVKAVPPPLPSPRAEELDPAMAVMIKYRVPRNKADDLPDFNNQDFDADADALRRKADQLASSNAVLAMSLTLMARPGHRRRVSDLIGGNHHAPAQLCTELNNTHVFRMPRARAEGEPLAGDEARDYDVRAVHVSTGVGECAAIPCATCGAPCDSSGVTMSMENVPVPTNNGRFSVSCSTNLMTRVPVPYMSWHDFGIMLPARAEKSRLGAAFISNCGFPKRNDMVVNLRHHTANRVHSYGGCVRSDSENGPRGQNSKISSLQDHKFSMAFENSESEDYVRRFRSGRAWVATATTAAH